MDIIKVRKNFLLDKELLDKAQNILLQKHKNLTEAVSTYLRAIVKDPSILNTIETTAEKRTGSFIGMLDGEIGEADYKDMRSEHANKYE